MCLFRTLVLSSDALRIVAPRIAAFEAAMMVKSLPVMPSKISLIASKYPGLESVAWFLSSHDDEYVD